MNYVKKYFLIVVAALAMVPAPMSAGDRVVVHIDAQSYVKAKEAYKLERAKTNLFGLLILAGLVVIYDSRDKVQRHLRSAVDFVKKHKTKIICGVLAVAALATGYCYRDEVWEFFSPGEPKFATDNFRLDNSHYDYLMNDPELSMSAPFPTLIPGESAALSLVEKKCLVKKLFSLFGGQFRCGRRGEIYLVGKSLQEALSVIESAKRSSNLIRLQFSNLLRVRADDFNVDGYNG